MSQEKKPIKIKKLPVIYNKIIWKKDLLPGKNNVKFVKSFAFQQEDVIYDSKTGGFVFGDLQEITIVNRLNKLTNTSRTVAKCKSQFGDPYERTSDDITKLIGQKNYDTLFSTLCSVINQELKIRGIFSLLTPFSNKKSVFCQTEESKNGFSNTNNAQIKNIECQTDESYISILKKLKMKRKRVKRTPLTPYVIREPDTKKPKKLVIPPKNFSMILNATEAQESQKDDSILPDLGPIFNEDSNNSIGKCSALSINTTSDILMNPLSILADVDRVTCDINQIHNVPAYNLHNLGNSMDNLNVKPVPLNELLRTVPTEQRVKMLLQQGLHDWQNCLKCDINGHMPIHVAILNNDLDLLKRQCLVFKMRGMSVDIPADNLTPLKMSLYQDNIQLTSILLEHQADALDTDEKGRNCFHVAAERSTDHLQALVSHFQHNARKILEDDDELWKPEYTNKTDTELAAILLNHVNTTCDHPGYTPLMLASKLGRYDNVKVLVESCPNTVNTKMPSCGNTALYLAVEAACLDSAERGNKSKVVDHFRKTIEVLVENGADPNAKNFTGASVNDLLTEFNISDLSMLIANKLTSRNFNDGKISNGNKKFDSIMLFKSEDGSIETKKLVKSKKGPRSQTSKPSITNKTKEYKTSILENIEFMSPVMPKKEVLVKSESLTDQSSSTSKGNKNKAIVQNFRLDKPLIVAVNMKNKKKIEIKVDPDK